MTHWTKYERPPTLFGRIGVGSGGTQLGTILAGSAQVSTSAIGIGASQRAAKASVTGMTANHKVFLSGCISACEVICTGAAGSAGGFRADFLNTGSAAATGSTLTVDYFAIRDF